MLVALIALFVALGGSSYAELELPENSVGAKQLKDGAVGTSKLKDGAVGTDKLKDAAVGTHKLKDDAVGTHKLKDDAVGTDQLKDGAVGSDQLKDGAVTSAKVKQGSLKLSDIDPSEREKLSARTALVGGLNPPGGARLYGSGTASITLPAPSTVLVTVYVNGASVRCENRGECDINFAAYVDGTATTSGTPVGGTADTLVAGGGQSSSIGFLATSGIIDLPAGTHNVTVLTYTRSGIPSSSNVSVRQITLVALPGATR